ncbi:MAG: alpha/beta hydrolase-fold protein [Chloroherpetonaceae bacterium]|nr:alpha/beta hydrolase-fold protein [Chloroherpetonaceae bacterium]
MVSFPTSPTKVISEDTAIGLKGQLHDFENFPSKFVEARTISVWLPKDYTSHPERTYSVWYMHDGQNLFIPSRSFIGVDWGVDETMTSLVDSGKIDPVIVVGIYNTPKRTEEYSPKKAFDLVPDEVRRGFIERFGLRMKPISDEYLKFLVNELKPFIDSTYRTKRDPANTFVAGSSMGGLISAYAICEYPSVFGAAACISTHFPAGEGIMIDYLEKSLPSPENHKIYFDFGTKTLDSSYEPYQMRADSVMKRKGFEEGRSWVTKKFVGDEHSERAWRNRFSIPVTFLMSTQP